MRGEPALSLVVSTAGGVLVQAMPPDAAAVLRAVGALAGVVPAGSTWEMRVVAPGTVLS